MSLGASQDTYLIFPRKCNQTKTVKCQFPYLDTIRKVFHSSGFRFGLLLIIIIKSQHPDIRSEHT